ncbi:hypothetical protein CK203_017152 [Vitis vinifera]|uniref:Uncharacterized protein n=1 Tax=Vitis vinifera TaxID=29760 RepID=A0A438JZH8_VITVI|nr:hypothetical protein CK203_017152 [Vitis vinifera]
MPTISTVGSQTYFMWGHVWYYSGMNHQLNSNTHKTIPLIRCGTGPGAFHHTCLESQREKEKMEQKECQKPFRMELKAMCFYAFLVLFVGCDCRLLLVWVFRSFGGRNERHIHTTTWEHGKKHPQWLHHLHDQISPFLHFQVSAVQILGPLAFCAMYHL